jgi:hypothetical protein
MLFGSNILELALAMVFIYLLLSLLCSAVAEYIEAKMNYRSSDLEKGIRLLLDPKEQEKKQPGATALADDKSVAGLLYNHPLVKSLYRGEKRPSYIPSRTFALALWDMAFPAEARGVAPAGTHDLASIREAVVKNDVVSDEVKTALLALIDDAGKDFDKARRNIEEWYDSAMDRVSGWYKRRVQYILLAIGLITSALVNADTINIAKALATNDALRRSVVAAAEKTGAEQSLAGIPLAPKASPTATATPAPTQTPDSNTNSAAGAVLTATPPPARTPAPPANANQSPTATPTPADPAQKIGALRAQLDQLGLPIGWVGAKYETRDGQLVMTNASDPRRYPGDLGGWLLKILGIAITALAVSQGAPFWFDLLNKIIVIRSTVKPREKSPQQPSKDKPAPETQQSKS